MEDGERSSTAELVHNHRAQSGDREKHRNPTATTAFGDFFNLPLLLSHPFIFHSPRVLFWATVLHSFVWLLNFLPFMRSNTCLSRKCSTTSISLRGDLSVCLNLPYFYKKKKNNFWQHVISLKSHSNIVICCIISN